MALFPWLTSFPFPAYVAGCDKFKGCNLLVSRPFFSHICQDSFPKSGTSGKISGLEYDVFTLLCHLRNLPGCKDARIRPQISPCRVCFVSFSSLKSFRNILENSLKASEISSFNLALDLCSQFGQQAAVSALVLEEKRLCPAITQGFICQDAWRSEASFQLVSSRA